jgi:hypothetical protein
MEFMPVRLWPFILVFVCVVLGSALLSEVFAQTGQGGDFDDPVEYGDLVVSGILEDIHVDDYPLGDFGWPNPGNDDSGVALSVLEIAIDDVIRGGAKTDRVKIFGHAGLARMLSPGERLLICAYFNEKALENGAYYLRDPRGVFMWSDDTWTRLTNGQRVTPQAVRDQVSNSHAASLVHKADAIVIGRVIDSVVERGVAADGKRLNQVNWTLHIESTLKGDIEEEELVVMSGMDGSVEGKWQVPMPSHFDDGEDWLLFLIRTEIGYFPFAGRNGVLRVRGEDLLYDVGLSFSLKKSELSKLAKME